MTRKRFIKSVMSEKYPTPSRNYANFAAEFVRLVYGSYLEGLSKSNEVI